MGNIAEPLNRHEVDLYAFHQTRNMFWRRPKIQLYACGTTVHLDVRRRILDTWIGRTAFLRPSWRLVADTSLAEVRTVKSSYGIYRVGKLHKHWRGTEVCSSPKQKHCIYCWSPNRCCTCCCNASNTPYHCLSIDGERLDDSGVVWRKCCNFMMASISTYHELRGKCQ